MVRGRLAARQLVDLLGDWRGEGPAYEALAERIRLLLIDGRISADVRLPSEREIAEHLDLSRTTVTAAYRTLREMGYARSVQGSGTTTLLPLATPDAPSYRPHLVDLSKASMPATSLLPDAARLAVEDLDPHLLDTGYHLLGLPELRAAIAARYAERGLPTEPDQVVVTTGAQSAIALLARALVARGDRAYAESPSYPHAYDALQAAGARVVTSPVTPEAGWDVAALEATFARTTPSAAYVQPDFQNPTGRSMSDEDRVRLLRAAARVDCVVIADETTGELAIDDGPPVAPLATLAAEHRARVIHVGSASKLFWGGLRIGWIRADREVLGRVAGLRPASDLGSPVWDQLVTTRLVPHSAQVIAERREQLRERRAALYVAVATYLPDWELPDHLRGGLVAWAKLPVPVSSQLTLAARARGVYLTAGPRFGVDGAYERFLRIPLSPAPATLTDAMRTLGELWPRVVQAPPVALTMNEPVV